MTTQRLTKLFELMKQNKLETIAINPGASLFYLTGLHFHLMERPVILLIKQNIEPIIILPILEAGKIIQSKIKLDYLPYSDNPESCGRMFNEAFSKLRMSGNTISVEPSMRFLEKEFIENALPNVKLIPNGMLINSLREKKDISEIQSIRRAVKIAENALRITLPQIKIGMTELEVASELTIQLHRVGSETKLPFQPIVASGPNSANPHAEPTERKLQKGDMLVIDWGAMYEGYISDLTRTFAIQEISQSFSKIASLVLTANRAGCERGKPDLKVGLVDFASRDVISKEGFGEYFTHRTGHGIGIEAHEAPYVFAENESLLQPGMCYTVEPGIYIPGQGGVRIEDDLVVTSSGSEVLSKMNRKVEVLG